MELHQLKYFVAVVESGGFSRAAEHCQVAQPSLSQQIIKLERELGKPLFDRLGRTVKLTEAGQLLLPYARRVLSDVEAITRSLNQEIEAGHGHLTVGMIPTIAPFLLPTTIRLFSQQYPKAELTVHEALTQDLIAQIVKGQLDIAIMSLPINEKLIVTETLFTEPLLLASSTQHAPQIHTNFMVKDLESVPFIALDEVHCLGEQVQAFCYQRNVSVDVVCYTAQLATVQSCVAAGLGVSLIPQIMAVQDQSSQVAYQMIKDEVPTRKIVTAVHRNRYQSLLAHAFAQCVAQSYQTLMGEAATL